MVDKYDSDIQMIFTINSHTIIKCTHNNKDNARIILSDSVGIINKHLNITQIKQNIIIQILLVYLFIYYLV